MSTERIWDEPRSRAHVWRDKWTATADAHLRAAQQGFVFTHKQCEVSRAEMRSRVRRRVWSAPRFGVLAVLHPGTDGGVTAALAASAAALVRRDAVISHESAAVLHGLPVLHPRADAVVTMAPRAPDGSAKAIHVHRATLPRHDVANWYGAAVTSVARTVADIARSDRSAGLLTADAALREGLVIAADLHAAAQACSGWPGARGAAWVARHADALSESPLESLTRACLIRAGLPAPELQIWIPEARARVDLFYRAERVVIEADGLLKYTEPATLRTEKQRHERLVRAGYAVVRLMWSDVVHTPAYAVALVQAAIKGRPLFSYEKPTIEPPRVGFS